MRLGIIDARARYGAAARRLRNTALWNRSAAMKTILVSFLKIVYSRKPLNNLASYDTVLSACYLHSV